MTAHAVIGFSDVISRLPYFRRVFRSLFRLATEREPDVIICVDFGGFNLRFTHAIKRYIARRNDWFHDWQPKIIQYVSPQVWASRPGRAYQIARDYDLLLSIVPFEKNWYSKRVPKLRVEFVGHPIVERYARREARVAECGIGKELTELNKSKAASSEKRTEVVLFPGSRRGELRRHLPILVEVVQKIAAARKANFRMVLPNETLAEQARSLWTGALRVEIKVGGAEQALREVDVAITKSGTITLECALFGVPAVVFYKTSFFTYVPGRLIATVKYLAMPNLLDQAHTAAGTVNNEPLFPEFIQGAATPEAISRVALDLLSDDNRRENVTARLKEIVASLGPPGASQRAAKAISNLLEPHLL